LRIQGKNRRIEKRADFFNGFGFSITEQKNSKVRQHLKMALPFIFASRYLGFVNHG
jgi:hypothetical protein